MESTFTHTTQSIAELLNKWQITNHSLIEYENTTVTISSEAATRIIDGESVYERLHTEDHLDLEIIDAERDIQALISGLYSGESLSRSEELEALAEEAIQYPLMRKDNDNSSIVRLIRAHYIGRGLRSPFCHRPPSPGI